MQHHAIMYPANEFSVEVKSLKTTGGFGGDVPRHFTQLKYVLPGLDTQSEHYKQSNILRDGVRYNIKTAIVCSNAQIRQNALYSIVEHLTIRGIGRPQGSPRHDATKSAQDVVELLLNQVGLGSTQQVIRALINRLFYHVDAQQKTRANLSVDTFSYGKLGLSHTILHDVAHLPNNRFPTENFSEINHVNGNILLTQCMLDLTREGIHRILSEANHVSWKYDKSPRIVMRIDLPHDAFDNLGSPEVTAYTQFSIVNSQRQQHQTTAIPLDTYTMYT